MTPSGLGVREGTVLGVRGQDNVVDCAQSPTGCILRPAEAPPTGEGIYAARRPRTGV